MNTSIAMSSPAETMSAKLFGQTRSSAAAATADGGVQAVDLAQAGGESKSFADLIAAAVAKMTAGKTSGKSTQANAINALWAQPQTGEALPKPATAALAAQLMAMAQNLTPQVVAPVQTPLPTGTDVAAALPVSAMGQSTATADASAAAVAVSAGIVPTPMAAGRSPVQTAANAFQQQAGQAMPVAEAAAAQGAMPTVASPAAAASRSITADDAGVHQIQTQAPSQAASVDPMQPATQTAAAVGAMQAYSQQIAAAQAKSATAETAQPRTGLEALANAIEQSGATAAGVREQVEPAAEAMLSAQPAPHAIAAGATVQDITAPKTEAAAGQTAQAPLAQQIGDQLAAAGAGRNDQVVIHLDPPDLGKVRATFQSDGDGVRCTLQVDNPQTLAQIRNETPALVARLAESGVEIKHVETSLRETGGNTAFGMLSDGSSHQQAPGQWQQQPSWRGESANVFRDVSGEESLVAAAAGEGDSALNVWL